MQVIRSKYEMEALVNNIVLEGKTIGFVPTMGYLHEGHLSLIEAAKKDNDVVICSIFVNPTQFNNPEDYQLYPRNEERDFKMLEGAFCDCVFAPGVELVKDIVDVPLQFNGIDEVMEGKFRPGHFKGVVNIVSLLFQIAQPTRAYFGQKDFQQLAIIQQLAKSNFPKLTIVPIPTLREKSGLAMSSRNARLSEDEKVKALQISAALFFMKEKASEIINCSDLKKLAMEQFFSTSDLELEYLEISDAETLKPLSQINQHKAVICIAAFCGKVRLIDNIIINY